MRKNFKIKKDYVKNFVMILNHLNDYKNNIQSIFSKISKTKNQQQLDDYVSVLESNRPGLATNTS